MSKKTHRPFLVAGQGVLPAKRMFYWLLYHLNMLKHMTSNLNRMQEYAEFYLTKHKSSTLRRTAERLLCAIVSTADRRQCWMTVVFRKRLGTTVTCKRDAKLTQRYLKETAPWHHVTCSIWIIWKPHIYICHESAFRPHEANESTHSSAAYSW